MRGQRGLDHYLLTSFINKFTSAIMLGALFTTVPDWLMLLFYGVLARATDDSHVIVTDESLAMWVVIVLHVLEREHLYSNAQLLMLSMQCTVNVRTHWKISPRVC